MSYTSEEILENYLNVDIDASLSAQLVLWIAAADSFINKYTNRPEGFDNKNETRLYDGNGETEIKVDHFTGSPTVTIREANGEDTEFTLVEGLDDDYVTFPYNETVKYKLIMSVNSQVATWLKGRQRIVITASFGSDSVPADIQLASTILVADVINVGAKGGGKVMRERLGDYSIDFGDISDEETRLTVKNLLDHYKILEVG